MDRAELIAQIPMLSVVSAEGRRELAQRAQVRRIEAGETVFSQGDQGFAVYLVRSGKLEVVRTSKTGRRLALDIIGPGEIFGELALLTGAERSASVTALETSELVGVDRRDFVTVIRSAPELSLALLQHLAERLVALTEQTEDIATLDVRLRLARKIARLTKTFGEERDEGLWLPLRLSQGEWSDLVGVSREAVNKQFGAWAREGFLRLDKDGILILDRARLEALGNSAAL